MSNWGENHARSVTPLRETDPAATEAELIARAQRDRRAFAPLYAKYLDPVYRYCYRQLGSRPAAEDATSQIFYQALAALDRFRGDSFRAWLFTIAHHVVVDLLRRKRAAEPLDAAYDVPDRDPLPEEAAFAADSAQQVRRLLAELPLDQRSVIELRLAGLTGPEIAAALGRSHGAVKMLQFRAFARLRECFRQPEAHVGSQGEV